jgi:hypothetical protein
MTQTVRRPSTPDRAVFGRPASRRPRWWLELTLIAIGYGLYSLVHDVVPEHPSAALAHGRAVERLEHPLFLDWTLPVNRFVAAHEWLAQPMDYYYATLHFIVTPAVLLWLFVGRPRRYRWARNVLVGTTLLALIGFAAFPTAPPRLLPGFGYVDTVIRFHTWGSLADPNIADHANQYAAMPSLHVAWAVWCGVTIFRCAPGLSSGHRPRGRWYGQPFSPRCARRGSGRRTRDRRAMAGIRAPRSSRSGRAEDPSGAVEDGLHHAPRAAGSAAVVVDQLTRIGARRVSERPAHRAEFRVSQLG